jgi:hypothetical protein
MNKEWLWVWQPHPQAPVLIVPGLEAEMTQPPQG